MIRAHAGVTQRDQESHALDRSAIGAASLKKVRLWEKVATIQWSAKEVPSHSRNLFSETHIIQTRRPDGRVVKA